MLKYFWAGKAWSFWVTLAVVLTASGVLAHYAETEFRSYSAEFVIETDRPVLFDIYYDIGRGYNEVDHQSEQVETVGEPVTLDFCIPVWNRLEKLRFDPARQHAFMRVYSITLRYGGDRVFSVPLDTLAPKQQIVHHSFNGREYDFETAPDGEDPIIELPQLGSPPGRTSSPFHYLVWLGTGVLLLLLGGFLHRFFILGR